MELLSLFLVASMPVLKLLLLTALGSFLALDRIGILGPTARKNLNTIVYYVFGPAIVSSNLAKTVTLESIALVWFMPINMMFAFLIGSALGWILVLITRAPQHLKGIVFGCCSAGNFGIFPLIIFPAVCKEKGGPFGDPQVCHDSAMSYASLSMAIGAVYIWSYVYNIVRVLSITDSTLTGKSTSETTKLLQGNSPETNLISKEHVAGDEYGITLSSSEPTVPVFDKIKQLFSKFFRKINLKELIAPATIGAAAGFVVGLISPLRRLMIGPTAPLRAIEDSALLLGEATIPTMTLIVGGNLLNGLKGSGVPLSIIIGIIAIRYIMLPLSGIFIVKGAIYYGLVNSNPLYQFVLLVQYALPPAMNIGTITQLFGAGQSECSVILLWTYLVSSVSLTLWSTLFMLLVS